MRREVGGMNDKAVECYSFHCYNNQQYFNYMTEEKLQYTMLGEYIFI